MGWAVSGFKSTHACASGLPPWTPVCPLRRLSRRALQRGRPSHRRRSRRAHCSKACEVTCKAGFVYTMYLQGAVCREDSTRKMGQQHGRANPQGRRGSRQAPPRRPTGDGRRGFRYSENSQEEGQTETEPARPRNHARKSARRKRLGRTDRKRSVVAREYVPDAGDLIWLDFTPQAGREQAGPRPAVVLSPRSYNERTSLAVVCP